MGTATVVACDDVATRIRMITLRPDRPVAVVPPGSHVDVAMPLGSQVATRSYSLVDLGCGDGLLRVAVRLDPAGRGGSRWMHSVTPGRRVDLTGPIGAFDPSPGRPPSVLLAGGIGVTPVVGLARAVRATGADYRVVYTGRSRRSMAFVDHLARSHPGRVRVVETEREPPVDVDALVASVPDDGVLYVCGPMRLLTAVRAAWQGAGRPPGALRFETFGTSGTLPAGPFRVTVASRGVATDVPVGTTLLDALEGAGVEIMYDCLRGECGLCRVRVVALEGALDHRDVFLSERQRAEGRELCTCVSRVAGTSITVEC